MEQIDVFFNGPSGKWVVRIGTLPMSMGGAYGSRMTARILEDDSGNVMLFDTRADAEAAAKGAAAA